MPMMPKRVKFRKSQAAARSKETPRRGNTVAFGESRFAVAGAVWVSARQIEAGPRRGVMHFLRREGRVFIRIFPHKPISGKAAGNPHG